MLCRRECLRGVRVLCVLSTVAILQSNVAMAQYQNERDGTSTAPAQSGTGQVIRGSSGGSSLHIVPTLSVSERYDSNIFRGAGRQVSDFVTEIRPGARAVYSGDLFDGNFSGGVVSGIYVDNSKLNYVGGQGAFDATLDKMTGRVARGLGLRYSGSVTYYPEQPAFVAPDAGEADFARGIQAQRNNTVTNASTIQSTYAMTPLVQLNASYAYQTRRFLGQPNSSDPSVPIGLFNTTVHSVSTGPSYTITPNHSVGTSYVYRQIASEPTSAGAVGRSTSVHGAMATWRAAFSHELKGEVSAGASVLSSVPDNLIWTMQASLQWLGQGKSAVVSFNRSLQPSYFAQAATLVSNVVNGTFTYNFNSKWSASLGANYALNIGTEDASLRFETIGGSGSVTYSFYPGCSAIITGSHTDFSIERPGSTLKYDRQVGMLSLAVEWN